MNSLAGIGDDWAQEDREDYLHRRGPCVDMRRKAGLSLHLFPLLFSLVL